MNRDTLIVRKALAYAIGTIDSLPDKRQEKSDRDHMARILRAMMPDEFERNLLAHTVEVHTGRRPNFDPEPTADAESWGWITTREVGDAMLKAAGLPVDEEARRAAE